MWCGYVTSCISCEITTLSFPLQAEYNVSKCWRLSGWCYRLHLIWLCLQTFCSFISWAKIFYKNEIGYLHWASSSPCPVNSEKTFWRRNRFITYVDFCCYSRIHFFFHCERLSAWRWVFIWDMICVTRWTRILLMNYQHLFQSASLAFVF